MGQSSGRSFQNMSQSPVNTHCETRVTLVRPFRFLSDETKILEQSSNWPSDIQPIDEHTNPRKVFPLQNDCFVLYEYQFYQDQTSFIEVPKGLALYRGRTRVKSREISDVSDVLISKRLDVYDMVCSPKCETMIVGITADGLVLQWDTATDELRITQKIYPIQTLCVLNNGNILLGSELHSVDGRLNTMALHFWELDPSTNQMTEKPSFFPEMFKQTGEYFRYNILQLRDGRFVFVHFHAVAIWDPKTNWQHFLNAPASMIF